MALSRKAFLACNRRRIDLIRKQYRGGGLVPLEAAELERLQREAAEYVCVHGVNRRDVIADLARFRDELKADAEAKAKAAGGP